MIMSPLAEAVYELLRLRTGMPDPRITYGALARDLRDVSDAFETVTHRSRELYVSLDEIGQECRRLGLPPLPALVVRADIKRPGAAYYVPAAPDAVRRGEPIAAWREDLEAVRRTNYPKRKRDKTSRNPKPKKGQK
jgi:hypothetical protein